MAELNDSVMEENKVNPSGGSISLEAFTQLASIPEEKDTSLHGSDREDAVLAKTEEEKTLALIKAWEECEKAKVMNRAHKKVLGIGSWETNRRESVEELIKKAEEDAEKKKVEYAEKVRNKIEALRKDTESKMMKISSKRGEDIAKVEDRATKFRSTGYVPRDFFRVLRILKQ